MKVPTGPVFRRSCPCYHKLDGSITQVRALVAGSNRGRMTIDLRVRDPEHLYRIIAKLNAVKGVMEVLRG